jgi:hypothetical protein
MSINQLRHDANPLINCTLKQYCNSTYSIYITHIKVNGNQVKINDLHIMS